MILVVADTGPINYLVQIGAVDILGKLFDEVVIPELVQQELVHPEAPAIVRNWATSLPKWAKVQSARFEPVEKLAPAETQAIELAGQLRAFAIVLDDREARDAARTRGLRIFGTTGILEEAAKNDLIDLPSALAKLRTTNFRVTAEVIQAALERDSVRKRGRRLD